MFGHFQTILVFTQLHYWVRPLALFDRIDGDHRTFEKSQKFVESLNNSAKIFVKHCDVWETFGQTPKSQSLLVFFA
jgi:hypothetical protein